MGQTKFVIADSWAYERPVAQILPVFSRGFDFSRFDKYAAAEENFLEQLKGVKIKPNRVVVHALAVGDFERYGFNRNLDGFTTADNKKCHRRFVDDGFVFNNHRNFRPELQHGEVLVSRHNSKMFRIELIVALDRDKLPEACDAAERGDDVSFSMGSRQAYDVCSWCGHRAPTPDTHCRHIKEALGEVREDGVVCGMMNPDPGYFDFSVVPRGADRIALMLQKVASSHQKIAGYELATLCGLRHEGVKVATLVRLAALEKRFEAHGTAIPTQPRRLPEHLRTQLKQAVAAHDPTEVLGAMHGKGLMLDAHDFADVVLDDPSYAEGDSCPVSFEDLKNVGDTDLDALDGDTRNSGVLSDDLAKALEPFLSMEEGPVRARVVRMSIMGMPEAEKTSPKTAADAARRAGFADLYAHYKLAFAHHHRDQLAVLSAVASPSKSIAAAIQHP